TGDGAAEPDPPPSRPVEPAPEQSVLACAKTAAVAIFTLPVNGCRWPHGDPGRAGFHFCGAVTEKGPYCEEHRRAAYLAASMAPVSNPLRQPFHLRRRTTLAAGRLPLTTPISRSAHLSSATRF